MALDHDAGFAIVFEYRVPPDRCAAFEREYGSDGDWARFFRRDEAYRGTELWAFEAEAGRYLVIDRWACAADYHAFRERHREEYGRRGTETRVLYASERVIGEMLRR